MPEKPALLPAYLIVGPDELKRSQAVARLRARVDGPFAAFNLEEIQATGDLDEVSVLASLNTLPMGGDREGWRALRHRVRRAKGPRPAALCSEARRRSRRLHRLRCRARARCAGG